MCVCVCMCVFVCPGPGHSGGVSGFHSCCNLWLDPRGTFQAGPCSAAVCLQRGHRLYRLSAPGYGHHTGRQPSSMYKQLLIRHIKVLS